jgi:hypothetical protein
VISTIYLAVALALCVGILLLAYWAWAKLPELFRHGPDSAELREREKREREIAAKRRQSP